ncbi:hypothetical protein D7Y13_12490 [Corallococcus praedator]|uniref:Uncharacterized protein n=1 Tax=Corallococcus praedator TaxID=2316724 RepID=A0ABX9QJP6_9BACT|nr:hypothetical protein D7X74_12880 [Corallococcus sp. CA047B]RKH32778.1 hypothetical protein D7X75_14560 [Corallococcus sp. CA031C]RKI10532.1 hypothetical protein D7Y13_12490 [Corallococcus praedator]
MQERAGLLKTCFAGGGEVAQGALDLLLGGSALQELDGFGEDQRGLLWLQFDRRHVRRRIREERGDVPRTLPWRGIPQHLIHGQHQMAMTRGQ